MKKLALIVLSLILVVSLIGCSKDQSNQNQSQTGNSPLAGYPSKQLEVIVAYKAGGGTDVGARILTSAAEKSFGKPIVIINRDGSDGELGWTQLVKSKADGYTIGFVNLPTFVSLPLERKTEFTKDDVTPILNHVYDPGVVVVRKDSQWKSIEEFLSYAKNNPEVITVANNGTGASNHIGAAHLEYEANVRFTHVPFGGTTDLLAALRGKHVDAAVAKISEVANLVSSGDLAILAAYTPERLSNFSEVPTLKEKGYDITFGSARALVAPKGTPQEIIDYLHDLFKAAMESQEHIDKANNANLPIKYMGPKELKEYMDNEEIYLKEIKPKLNLGI